jgi:SSS family solute:Na+ symporter
MNRIGREKNIHTISQYLEINYDVRLKTLSAILNAVCSSIIVGSQIIAGASVIAIITGINMTVAVFITGAFILYYTVTGGLWAVALTDVIQGGIVWIGMILALPLAIKFAGGWSDVKAAIDPAMLSLSSFTSIKFFLAAALASILNNIADQSEIQRMFAAKDPDTAKKSLIWRFIIQTPIGWIAGFLGLISFVIFSAEGMEASMYLPNLIKTIYSPVVGGIILVALMGAVMSTGDTLLSAGATVLTEDIYHGLYKKDATDKELLKTARIITLLLGIFSIVICFYLPGIVGGILLAFTIKGSALAFPVIASLIWPNRLTKEGAFWGAICTLIALIIWNFAKVPFDIDPVFIGVLVSIVASIIISKLTNKKELGA